MNKLTFVDFISKEPAHPTAIYLCGNKGICDNIILSGRAAVYISRNPTDTAFFSLEEFVAYIEKNYLVKPVSSYTLVPCLGSRKMNEDIYGLADQLHFRVSRDGWHIFWKKEYLAELSGQPEVERILSHFEKRLFGPARDEVDISRFHAVSKNGTVTGVLDIEIVRYLISAFDMFVMNAWTRTARGSRMPCRN